MTSTDSLKLLAVDDHESVLSSTVSVLQKTYPNATIYTAMTAKAVSEALQRELPDLLVMDLSIPAAPGEPSAIESGIDLLRDIMETYTELNIVVQSAHVRSLVRLRPVIDRHQGGLHHRRQGVAAQGNAGKSGLVPQGIDLHASRYAHGHGDQT